MIFKTEMFKNKEVVRYNLKSYGEMYKLTLWRLNSYYYGIAIDRHGMEYSVTADITLNEFILQHRLTAVVLYMNIKENKQIKGEFENGN